MQEPVKPKKGRLPQGTTKIGMTVEERENLIIFLTRMFSGLPFEYKAFSDGSVGLEVEAADTWVTVRRPEDYLGSCASEAHFNDQYGHIFSRDTSVYQRVAGMMRWQPENTNEYCPVPAFDRALKEAIKYAESRKANELS